MTELALGLSQVRLPARLTVEQVANTFQTTAEGVYHLTKCRLLRPLGNPPPNGTKYYARVYIERLAHDEKWLSKASDALVQFKWHKNHGKNRKDA